MQTRGNWWPGLAALLAGVELFVAGGIWVDRLTDDTVEIYEGTTVRVPSEAGPLYGDILLTGLIALGAVAIIAGLSLRLRQPGRGRGLIVAGLIPAALAGVVFFWFPPFWIVSLLAVTVMVMVSRETEPAEPVSAHR